MNNYVTSFDKDKDMEWSDDRRVSVVARIKASMNGLKEVLNGNVADDFNWSDLQAEQIVKLLTIYPEHADKVDLSSLGFVHWHQLIETNEEFIECCDWHEVTRNLITVYEIKIENNVKILVKNPQYIKHLIQPDIMGENVKCEILKNIPQMHKYFDLKLFGHYLTDLLIRQPQLHKYCDLRKVNDWATLLKKQPYLKQYCDFKSFVNYSWFWKNWKGDRYKSNWLIIQNKKRVYDKDKKLYKLK